MTEPTHEPRPYKCPVCDGQGHLNKPPCIAGVQDSWCDYHTRTYPCHHCEGTGVIWRVGVIWPT